MRINVAIPEDEVTKPILDASLEAVTRLNEQLIRSGKVPLFRDAVHRVQWAPEPPGDEHFDHAGIVLARGKGDCDDLSPWHTASLRVTGEDRGAKAVVKRSGPKRWHAVTERSNAPDDDPSREAGMRPGIPHFIRGARVASLGSAVGEVGAYIALPRLAVRPIRTPLGGEIQAWQSRADLPWHWSPTDSPTDIAMASLHASPVSSQMIAGLGALEGSIIGALEGAIQLAEAGDDVDTDTINVAEAMTWVCGGADYQDVRREFGEECADAAFSQVNGLFQKIGNGFKKIGQGIVKVVTSKLGRAIISIVPGVGPAAAAALDATGPALRKLAAGKVKEGKIRKTQIKVSPAKVLKKLRKSRGPQPKAKPSKFSPGLAAAMAAAKKKKPAPARKQLKAGPARKAKCKGALCYFEDAR